MMSTSIKSLVSGVPELFPPCGTKVDAIQLNIHDIFDANVQITHKVSLYFPLCGLG